ncbi:MAG: hypothetical protein MNPFHGCM_00258 [Gemmatimonadaceae bacterium]|nr:hypothetical protein [Gemmatimonadaceae bacterium]
MATGDTKHLLGVWNPSYEADAMDAHIGVLLRHARSHTNDVHVWWGKLRSQYRQAPLPHLGDVLALEEQIARDDDTETQLYLTDFRSLYVAHVGSIVAADVRDDRGQHGHIPPYYLYGSRVADCWFRLRDIRRLVLDDTLSVASELRNLLNSRYNDQRVSLYGGMVDLPLIVRRPDGKRWFDTEERERLTGGRCWVEFDAERAGTGEMQRDLRDNRFGARLWGNLDPAARSFIATAEQLYRTHRNDAAFDLSAVIIDFAKAMEVQVNGLVRRTLGKAAPALRMFTHDQRLVDITARSSWGLGELHRIVSEDRQRNEFLRKALQNGEWFAASLPPVLEELRVVRNKAAHGGAIERERIDQLRGALIGVGSKGGLVELAGVTVR